MAALPQQANAAYGERITISGNQFKAGGDTIWINGVNTPWIIWNEFGSTNFDYFEWDLEMCKLKNNGINAVRVWISCSGEVGFNISNEGYVSGVTQKYWDDLDDLFEIAQNRGIYVMATLMSFDHFKNTYSTYQKWRNWLQSDDNIDSYINNFLIPFVERYNDNPYLWSIDLMNEPDWVFEQAACGQISWERLQTYFAKAAAAIHENSDVLVTVNICMIKYMSDMETVDGAQGNKLSDSALMAMAGGNENARIDFYSPHHYPWMESIWGNPFYITPEQYGFETSKPIVIAESPAKGSNPEDGKTAAMDYENAYLNGWQGVMAWTSNGVDSNGDLDDLKDATNGMRDNHYQNVYPAIPTPEPIELPAGPQESPEPTEKAPYNGEPFAVPGKIEAEEFDFGGEGVSYHDTDDKNEGKAFRKTTGVDIENCTEGGYNVGFAKPGEWLEYTINVTTTDAFDIGLRVSTPSDNVSMHLEFDGVATDSIAIPKTGGWQSWRTVKVEGVLLTEGLHTMRICFETNDLNINYVTIGLEIPEDELPETSEPDEIVLFDDGLDAAWDDWSWGCDKDFDCESPVYSGSKSLALTMNAWGALQLHTRSASVDISGFTDLVFYINGGEAGDQNLKVMLVTPEETLPPVNLNDYIEGSSVPAGEWKKVQIPLSDLISDGSEIVSLIIQSLSDSTMPVFYLDEIKFVNLDSELADIFIYDEGIDADWDNWGWNCEINYDNTNPVYSGSKSMAVIIGNWGAFWPNKRSGFVDASRYTHLEFYIHGGETGGQNLSIGASDSSAQFYSKLSLNDYVEGGEITAGQWKRVRIPLTDMNVPDGKIYRIQLQDNTGEIQPVFYIDRMRFIKVRAPIVIYDDGFNPDWDNWGWNCEIDYDNTNPVYSGSKSMAVTISNWGAFWPNKRAGFVDASQYTHLVFYIHGGEAGGQDLNIGASDTSAQFYNKLSLSGYVEGGEITAGRWKKVMIPLSDLNAPEGKIYRIQIQDNTGGIQPVFYIDQMQFEVVETVEEPSSLPSPEPVRRPKPLPVISRNVPAYAKHESSNASRANDGDYSTYWRSRAQNEATWLAYDLSGVPAAQRKDILVVWYNGTGVYDLYPSGNNGYSIPQDYTIEVNSAAGGSVPEDGWEVKATVTGNMCHSRQHLIDMEGYNWIRINVTETYGDRGTNEDVSIQMDIHDASEGVEDSWLFLGDSITEGGMHPSPKGSTKTFAQLINELDPAYFPVQEGGGIGGWRASDPLAKGSDGRRHLDRWLEQFPGKYVVYSFGTNDSGWDVGTTTFYNNMKNAVETIIRAGKIPVIPLIPWHKDHNNGRLPLYNAVIEQLYEDYPHIIPGPDFYTLFESNPDLISYDLIHPTTEGYEEYRRLWAEKMYEVVYSAPDDTPETPETPDNPTPPASSPTVTPPVTDTVKVKPVLSNGVAVSKVDMATINSAFSQADEGDGVRRITLEVEPVQGASEYVQQLPGDIFRSSGDGKKAIEIKTSVGSITVPANMFSEEAIKDVDQVEISIGMADKSTLDPELQNKIGDRPVIELSARLDGKAYEWENKDAPVVISIDYTPSPEELEDPEHIVVWYIDGSGNVISVPNGRYDPETGKVTFKITHFSKFAIAFEKITFNDLNTCLWAADAIEILASKGVMGRIEGDSFSPDQKITRGMYVMWLVNTLGLSASYDSNFTDVDETAIYYESIAVVRKLGIALGDGTGKFHPDKDLSRQDMIVLTARALRAVGAVLEDGTYDDLAAFADAGNLAQYAKADVAAMVHAGFIKGSNGKLNPASAATKAEASRLLYSVYNR